MVLSTFPKENTRSLHNRKRLGWLILVLTGIVLTVTGLTINLLYGAAFEVERLRLLDTAHSQAHLIEAIARFDAENSQLDHSQGDFGATVSLVVEANRLIKGIGQTGEFTLAQREGDEIVFLLPFRHAADSLSNRIPLNSERAIPMRQALIGQAGTIIARDYRGKVVLAAYQPVEILNMGIVAKMDLDEIRKPFINAALIAIFIGMSLVVLGAFIFNRLTNPLLEQVLANEERLRTLINTAVDGIITIDGQGIVTSFNPAAEKIFGYEMTEVIERNVKMLMPTPYQGEHDNYLRRFLETGEPRVVGIGREVEGRRKDGTLFPMELTLSEMHLGQGVAFTGIARDLTEAKRLEEQARISHSLRTIGRLAGSVAHHVNNRLQVVRSNMELLENSVGDDPKTRRAMERIDGAIDRIAPVMEQMLSFSSPDKEGMADLDLNPLLRELMPLVEVVLGVDIILETHIGESPILVHGNRILLKDAVLQLCTNAKEAMSGQGVLSLSVSSFAPDGSFGEAHPWCKPGGYGVIGVRDGGKGMSTETLRTVYGPGHGRSTTEQESRLGLTIVRSVVGRHGGGLTVESALNQGTDVRLYLPLSSRGGI